MIDLRLGDCLEILPTIPSGSVDAIITDPPYPEISREYGRFTESEWWSLVVDGVIPEVRRILKPKGSAVFILQPNSKTPGSMRSWLWRFMTYVCEEWNQIQDAWWWNISAIPEGHAIQNRLMRPSLKACVWCGPVDCFRDQDAALWPESARQAQFRTAGRFDNKFHPSGHHSNKKAICDSAIERGGVTPFNVMPTGSGRTGGERGHPAATPLALANWWTSYICPRDGTVLDPFAGSGTMGEVALKQGKNFIGIEKFPAYHQIAKTRLNESSSKTPLFT